MKGKIVYCTPSLYIPGGIERVLTTKANYFADVLGYEIYIILTDGKDREPYYPLSSNIHIIQLDINFEELWHLSFLRKILAYLVKQRLFKKHLSNVLMEIKPDITISLLRREINFITSIKDGSYKIGEIHVNREHYRNFETGNNFFKRSFATIWQKQLIKSIKRLDKFIVLTEDDKTSWKELNNIEVIPNPLASFHKEASVTKQKQVVSIGRFSYEKGFDLLIKTWKIINFKHPDWMLKIYGSGNKQNLIPIIKKAHLSRSVRVEDPISDIYKIYLESSLCVCSSRFEGFGMVLAEAMACGVPCVSFDCPHGPRNIISNTEDGLLAEDGNIQDLADKICFLIENENIRKEFGQKAVTNIQRFSIEVIAQKWDCIFKSLIKHEEK